MSEKKKSFSARIPFILTDFPDLVTYYFMKEQRMEKDEKTIYVEYRTVCVGINIK